MGNLHYTILREKFIGYRHQLETQKKELIKTIIQLILNKSKRREWINARDFFIEVAKITQNDLVKYMEGTISLAMDIIPSEKPLKLLARFETRRNQPELDLFIQEGENEPILLSSTIDMVGKSVEEIIAFAGRLCLSGIQVPKPAPIQIHDEPFATLKKENIRAATRFIKELQQELQLQMIIVTQEDEIAEMADKLFYISKSKGKSTVREIK